VSAVLVPEGNGRWAKYAGGYADMLAQRGAEIAATKPARPSPQERSTPARNDGARAPARPRLSFHQKHALETLPDEIARLGKQARTLQTKLEDPELYARDRRAFDETSRALAAAQSALAAAEEKWLELELWREEVERG
jgi:ATP-binding cassette subfamily F protein uup